MTAPATVCAELTLEDEVLDLWSVERFDTAMIAQALKLAAELRGEDCPTTEADVAKIVADEMDRRHAARAKAMAQVPAHQGRPT